MTGLRMSLPAIGAALGLLGVAAMAWRVSGTDLALATLIGGFAGFSLYHASFGFTAGWRRIITEARGIGLRAQFLLIGLTVLVSYPLIGWGGANGWVLPVNLQMMVGAFLFGMGMQLGGGCGSGTLFVVGGGSTRMVITLSCFIFGSVVGVAHLGWWRGSPSLGNHSAISYFGVVGALVLTLALLGALAWWSVRREKSVHGSLEPARKQGSLIIGPWSPWAGAVALAIVGVLTLLVLNRPWGITQAFGFWGAKALDGVGVSRDTWLMAPWSDRALERSVFDHATSVMDFGIILGAMLASGLAGKFAPVWKLSFTEVATAVTGGLLMGYGARLGYGCNIGAYLGGLVSGSLHGWVWAVFAFAGSSLIAWWRMPRGGAPVPA